MKTKSLPPIHFFRPGRHTALTGITLEFSEADLTAAAEAYDPKLFRAPIVVGHPKLDDPAYGWVDKINLGKDGLYADSSEVEAQFADLVGEGRYKKVSARWFTPTARNNPVPGVYYLRHIGFLGAAAPAVTGLKPVEFADDDSECVTLEFGYDDKVNASLWRSMRDFFIGQFGQDKADQVIPSYAVQSLEESAVIEAAEDSNSPSPMYAQGGDTMTPEEQARMRELEGKAAQAEALAAENASLKSQSAEFADREAALAAREAEAARAEIVEFADGLVKDGKVLPRDKDALVAYLAGDADIEFAEGDATVKKTPGEWLRRFLQTLPVQVDYAERGAAQDDAAAVSAEFAAPDGYAVDQTQIELHRRALAHQKANPGTDYVTAVKAVSATK